MTHGDETDAFILHSYITKVLEEKTHLSHKHCCVMFLSILRGYEVDVMTPSDDNVCTTVMSLQ